jgi:hypothetical protein
MNINDYIKVYDKAISDEMCDRALDFYNFNPNLHLRIDNYNKPNFTQVNFTKNRNLDFDLHEYFLCKAQEYIIQYRSKLYDTQLFPEQYGFEEFRIKHYMNNGIDQFDTHVDSADHLSSKRFLAFFWYLNDVELGGDTIFMNTGFNTRPQKGKLVIFPPFWMFPHKGAAPISGEKYLMSSYLNYIP